MLACTMLLADRVVLPYSVVMYNIACWQGCATIQCWVCTSVTCWQGCAAIQCRCVTRCPTSAAAPVVPWPCQPNNWKVTLPCLNTHTHTHTHTHQWPACAGGTEDRCVQWPAVCRWNWRRVFCFRFPVAAGGPQHVHFVRFLPLQHQHRSSVLTTHCHEAEGVGGAK